MTNPQITHTPLTKMKARFEHGIQLNLILDHCPKGIEDQQFE